MLWENMWTEIVYTIKKFYPLLMIKIVACYIKRSLLLWISWVHPHILINKFMLYLEFLRNFGQKGAERSTYCTLLGMTPWCVQHLIQASGWQTTGVGVGETRSKEQGRKSRYDGRRKSILWKALLITSANFLLCPNNSVISTFSKDGHDEVWNSLEIRVGKLFL